MKTANQVNRRLKRIGLVQHRVGAGNCRFSHKVGMGHVAKIDQS